MDSLYCKYIKERTNDHILEDDTGFATYRYLDENTVYIIDIYILPEFRKQGFASMLADHICEKSKEIGFKKLLGSVIPSCKGATESILVLLGYGMKVVSSDNNLILFEKEL